MPGQQAAEAKLKEIFGKEPRYRDVLGLCKVVRISEIAPQGWSLSPGRYVGNTPGEDISDEGFLETFEALTEEFEALNVRAAELTSIIGRNAAELLDLKE